MGIRKSLWDRHEEQDVYLITISNAHLQLSLTNFGATIVSIMLPDKSGTPKNMVLGYDALDGYVNDTFYMGCTVGRFANRISGAAFRIEGLEYKLAANETGTGNHLHGGTIGFNKKVFSITDYSLHSKENSIQFQYKSKDGEEGYPGNLDVYVTYQLTEKNEVVIDYKATTDKTTPVNLTNHSYFNLSGNAAPALDHELLIHADQTLVADDTYIPTGAMKAVADTALDFRNWRLIQTGDSASFKGFNEYFSFPHAGTHGDVKAGLRHLPSGRMLTVKTTLPGLMLYTGDFLKTPYVKNGGICLETQFFPDSPNRPEFPSTLLHPGDVYQHQTIYQFFD